jgi:phosphoribosyl 1,2-cyclic phosphodiesterase
MMQFCVLGSGSKGNATYIRAGATAILIDGGFSGIELQRRLAAIGVDFASIGAILVTHEHNDHIRGVPVLSRRGNIPVFANPATYSAAGSNLNQLHRYQEFDTGTTFHFQDLSVHPFSVSHDTSDPVGFVITDGCHTIGYCTDTGRVTRLMQHRLAGCHGLILESNHDPEMLRNGPYPPYLKQRVQGKHGHLANHEAAAFLRDLVHDGLRHIVLAHISETNNQPQIAHATTMRVLATNGRGPEVSTAPQDRPTSLFTLGEP